MFVDVFDFFGAKFANMFWLMIEFEVLSENLNSLWRIDLKSRLNLKLLSIEWCTVNRKTVISMHKSKHGTQFQVDRIVQFNPFCLLMNDFCKTAAVEYFQNRSSIFQIGNTNEQKQ